MTGRELTRAFWAGAAAMLVVAALISLLAVLRGSFSDTDGRILGTLAALMLAGGTLISGLVLVDRDQALLGRLAAALSPVGFGLIAYAIWDFVFDGGGDSWRLGWLGILLLVALVMATTARLLAESPSLTPLAYVAGVLAAAAAAVSAYAVWEEGSDELWKLLTVLWILAGMCHLLVPILERFRGPASDPSVRVIATLEDVELVIARSNNGLVVELAPGERLLLRKRPSG